MAFSFSTKPEIASPFPFDAEAELEASNTSVLTISGVGEVSFEPELGYGLDLKKDDEISWTFIYLRLVL